MNNDDMDGFSRWMLEFYIPMLAFMIPVGGIIAAIVVLAALLSGW